MDSPVIRDIADDTVSTASPAAVTPVVEAPDHREFARHRFVVDPASSPLLVAALAWDTAVGR